MVFTASLLGAQHKKRIAWRTSRQACLLCPWARHLTGRIHLYVADRWLTRTSPDYNCEVANPACQTTLGYPPVAVRLVGGGATSHSRLVRNGLPSSPSLISIRLTMNLNYCSCRTSIPRKRRGKHTHTHTHTHELARRGALLVPSVIPCSLSPLISRIHFSLFLGPEAYCLLEVI